MLVSAPAGFGKTTLLAEWLAGAPFASTGQRSAAWLSLDRGDNDPASFWAYVIAALADGGTGSRHEHARTPGGAATATDPGGAHPAAQRPRLPRRATWSWCSTTTTSSTPARCRTGWRSCSTISRARLRLVIASRADPPLPLARMRARGELIEIRAAELRFTAHEAAAYLNGVVGLHADGARRGGAGGTHRGVGRRAPAGRALDAGTRRRPRLHRRFHRGRPLHRRLPGRGGPAPSARAGARLPAGHLAPEPAHRPAVRCGHRHERRQGHARSPRSRQPVPGPARRPTPVVPLPPPVRGRAAGSALGGVSPTLVRELHRRASDWYAENGERSEAIRHAIGGQHFERAAELVELAMPALLRDRQETHAAWLARADARRACSRSGRCSATAMRGRCWSTGETEGVERHLRDAERWLAGPVDTREGAGPPGTRMVVADDEELRRLPAGIAVHRAGLALRLGDLSTTVTQARRALTCSRRTTTSGGERPPR